MFFFSKEIEIALNYTNWIHISVTGVPSGRADSSYISLQRRLNQTWWIAPEDQSIIIYREVKGYLAVLEIKGKVHFNPNLIRQGTLKINS